MDNTPLQAFIGKVLSNRRLLYADLQRLQRDILPEGIRTPAEAEALLALKGLLDRVDEGWLGYLTPALRQFVLSISRPVGTIDHRLGAWLVSALSKLPHNEAVALGREVALGARHVDKSLLIFLGKGSKGKGKTPAAACRQVPDPRISFWPRQIYEWDNISVRYGDDTHD